MHVVNWPVLRPVIKQKLAMISLSVVAKGGNTSDGLTHTSVGSRFSAGQVYTNAHRRRHKCKTTAVLLWLKYQIWQVCSREGTDMDGLAKAELPSSHPYNLSSESQCILISPKTAKTGLCNEWRVELDKQSHFDCDIWQQTSQDLRVF